MKPGTGLEIRDRPYTSSRACPLKLITPAGSNGLFVFGSSKGSYHFQDTTARLASVMPGEWGSKNPSGKFINTIFDGSGILRANAYEGELTLSNAVFRGFSSQGKASTDQMTPMGRNLGLFGATSVTAEVPTVNPFLLDSNLRTLTFGATSDGFPAVSIKGILKVQAVSRLNLSMPEDGSAGRPANGTWTILKGTEGLNLPESWITGTLDQCDGSCDSFGFRNPARYTLIVEPTRLALKFPPSACQLIVR